MASVTPVIAAGGPSGPRALYLDLLKKSLSFALWPEPARPVSLAADRPLLKQALVSAVTRIAARFGLQLAKAVPVTDEQRAAGQVWPVLAHTMIGSGRLDSLQRCVVTALAEDVPGDLIEAGVWRGGACILMRGILAAYGVTDRRVYVADSFQGLPPPRPALYPADRGDRHYRQRYLAVSLEEVRDNFALYGLLDDQVVFLPGWFADTLPTAPVERLAVLRLDGDMYESTIVALTSLYPKLSPGGYCIVDDYALPPCRAAVHDFRRAHGIEDPIEPIDGTGALWRRIRG